MADKPIPCPTLVRLLVSYNPESGKLFWRRRARWLFTSDRIHKGWNARYAGQEAFTSKNTQGYHVGAIGKKFFKAHRVAMVVRHGMWPPEDVDHINRVRDDNRACNLRFATKLENARNKDPADLVSKARGIYSRYIGVTFMKNQGVWGASMKIDGRQTWLGSFTSEEDAARAYDRASRRYRGKDTIIVNFHA